jgi:tetratricopeptide (TPR) repeat protein/transcriptional regulator with XRE-family HTH domain
VNLEDPDFASLLRQHRRRVGLTQEQLADLSALSVRTIRNLERGETAPHEASVQRIADSLRLSTADAERLQDRARVRSGLGRTGPANPLPDDSPDFTGRAEQVAALRRVLTCERAEALTVVAISGRAGVGKTALAIHVAHQLAGHFPNGELYVNLRGANSRPSDAAEVLASLLGALGLHGSALPDDLEARIGLYRARLAKRRMLLLLDDAASITQLRPLLPGSSSCAVLITSRIRLGGLEGAHRLELDMLTRDEALELLRRLAGRAPVDAEPKAAARITRLCDQLPLALRIAGARLATRPGRPLRQLADRLADERSRLDSLGHGTLDVRSSISLSYRGLGHLERRAFRRLAMLDAPDFAPWVAAALLDLAPGAAEEAVERLNDARLLDCSGTDESGQLRFRFHDLVRLYARERALADEARWEWGAALTRLLEVSRALAARAEQRLVASGPTSRAATLGPVLDAVCDQAPLDDAQAWFESEWQSLAGLAVQACAAGLHDLACDLAAALATSLEFRGYFDQCRRLFETLVVSVRRTDNRRALAVLLRGVGDLHLIQHRYPDALACYEEARSCFREVGDRQGEAAVVYGTGYVRRLQGAYEEALACFEEAFVLWSGPGPGLPAGDRSLALNGIGWVHFDQGRCEAARSTFDDALSEARARGYPCGEARCLRSLGLVHQALGGLGEATAYLEQARQRFRELGDRASEVHAMLSLGDVYREQGRLEEARSVLTQCLCRYEEFGDRFNEATALKSLGELDLVQGELDAAADRLGRAARIYEQLGVPLGRSRALRSLDAVRAQLDD